MVNGLCGWLLHCKSFLAIFAVVFVSTVVCPACSCGGVPLALMNSASEVPMGYRPQGANAIPGVSLLLVDLLPHHHFNVLHLVGSRCG